MRYRNTIEETQVYKNLKDFRGNSKNKKDHVFNKISVSVFSHTVRYIVILLTENWNLKIKN
jgi:hypothetical protein